MTTATAALATFIGEEKAKFYANYLANGYKLTVYTFDGEYVVEDERGSVMECSFDTMKETQAAAAKWGVRNAVIHMEKEGEMTEISEGMEPVVAEQTEEEKAEMEAISAIDAATELVAEGMAIEDVVTEITLLKGYDIGKRVLNHFQTLTT